MVIKRIILLFLGWRVFLFVPLIASDVFLLPRVNYTYTLLTYFLDKSNNILSNFLIYPFGNFDAAYYLLIAAKGYTVNAGFFPLFPLVIYIVSLPFNVLPFDLNQYFLAIFLVSLFFFASLITFYKLVRLDYKENVAIWSIIFLLIFPTSFFYAAIYSESLFLLLSLSAFYFARKKKWLIAGLFGAFLSATRITGIFIFPSLLYEYFKSEKNKSLSKLLSISFSSVGLIAYCFYNFQKWGNPFYFIQAQGNFVNNRTVDSIILFPQTVFRYTKILFTLKPNIYEWWVAFFELSFFIFALILFYVAWKKEIRFSYLIFGALCFLLPVSSGTFSGLPRYILTIFPLFITLALIQNKTFKIIYSVVSVALLFLFFMLFSKGYFIA
ncbi:MAG: hypothetical protein HYW62_00240 [Candidatus Levybacteria bacterium]|nr:hypothetical protein [Candidatus Levybacteria bacterium]